MMKWKRRLIMRVHKPTKTMSRGSQEWGDVDDHIHDTFNRDYYISSRSSCGGVRSYERY